MLLLLVNARHRELTMHKFLSCCLARWLTWIVVFLLLPGAAFADRTVDGVPIPDDVSIAPDTAAASDNGRNFLGAWIGRWGGTLKHILILESLQSDGTAQVIYAVGDNPNANVKSAWHRLPATLRDDTLTITGAFTATYKLTTATTATGSFQSGRARSQAEMTKVDFAALTGPGRKVFVGDPKSIMIATKLRENGQPIRLEVAIAKPQGKGPFPLVVINHGSTGRGDNPALFRRLLRPRNGRVFRQEGVHGRVPAVTRTGQVRRTLRRGIPA